MYLAALFAFVLAALIGLTMAVMHFRGVESGKAMGLGHGVFAVSGIIFLASGLYRVDAGLGWWLLVSFGVVATAGLYLFSRQVRDKPWPAAVIIAHGGLALATIVGLGLWLADGPVTMDDEDGSTPAEDVGHEPIPVEDLVD